MEGNGWHLSILFTAAAGRRRNISFVLVLGMQDSRDPAEAQDRRLTAEQIAGFSASPIVCLAEIHFLVTAFCLKLRIIESGSVLEVSANGEDYEDAHLVATLNSQRTSQILVKSIRKCAWISQFWKPALCDVTVGWELFLLRNFLFSQLIILSRRVDIEKVTQCVNKGLNMSCFFSLGITKTTFSAGLWEEILNWLQYGVFISIERDACVYVSHLLSPPEGAKSHWKSAKMPQLAFSTTL